MSVLYADANDSGVVIQPPPNAKGGGVVDDQPVWDSWNLQHIVPAATLTESRQHVTYGYEAGEPLVAAYCVASRKVWIADLARNKFSSVALPSCGMRSITFMLSMPKGGQNSLPIAMFFVVLNDGNCVFISHAQGRNKNMMTGLDSDDDLDFDDDDDDMEEAVASNKKGGILNDEKEFMLVGMKELHNTRHWVSAVSTSVCDGPGGINESNTSYIVATRSDGKIDVVKVTFPSFSLVKDAVEPSLPDSTLSQIGGLPLCNLSILRHDPILAAASGNNAGLLPPTIQSANNGKKVFAPLVITLLASCGDSVLKLSLSIPSTSLQSSGQPKKQHSITATVTYGWRIPQNVLQNRGERIALGPLELVKSFSSDGTSLAVVTSMGRLILFHAVPKPGALNTWQEISRPYDMTEMAARNNQDIDFLNGMGLVCGEDILDNVTILDRATILTSSSSGAIYRWRGKISTHLSEDLGAFPEWERRVEISGDGGLGCGSRVVYLRSDNDMALLLHGDGTLKTAARSFL